MMQVNILEAKTDFSKLIRLLETKKEDFDIIYDAGYTSIIPAYIRFNVKKIKQLFSFV